MPETNRRVVLVTGATGNQGGAVARRLLADGWRVRALTRDPASPAALALGAAGAEVWGGDLDDRASLKAASAGIHGVFSVQRGLLGTPPVAVEDEFRQAADVAEAALAAGAGHVVQASVAAAEVDAPAAAFAVKGRIEEHLRAIGAPATILRPVSFMENYADLAFGDRGDTLTTAFAPQTPEQLVALTDIGAFAALVLGDPDRYLGAAIDIAGDSLTPPRIAAELTAATGRPVGLAPIPSARLRTVTSPAVADAYHYLNSRGGYLADLPGARAHLAGLLDFRTWLAARGRAPRTDLTDH